MMTASTRRNLFHDLRGLSSENAPVLLDALKGAAVNGDANVWEVGQRYVIDFEFAGPGGQAILRSAWKCGATKIFLA